MANIQFRNILFILVIIIFINTNLCIQITEIEKDLKVIDELSRISQIKSISNEIKDQAHRKSGSCQKEGTKVFGKSMNINTDIVIKGDLTCASVLTEEISISNNVNIAKTLSSNEILTKKVMSQTTILNELRSPTVINS
jgi:hypothetical protein